MEQPARGSYIVVSRWPHRSGQKVVINLSGLQVIKETITKAVKADVAAVLPANAAAAIPTAFVPMNAGIPEMQRQASLLGYRPT